MKAVGLIRELEPCATTALPSIYELRKKLPEAAAEAVIAYLNSGVDVLDVMEATPDPLDAKQYLPGGASLVTDGRWVWRKYLSYFVDRYRVGLTAEFVAEIFSGTAERVAENVLLQRGQEARIAIDTALGRRSRLPHPDNQDG